MIIRPDCVPENEKPQKTVRLEQYSQLLNCKTLYTYTLFA